MFQAGVTLQISKNTVWIENSHFFQKLHRVNQCIYILLTPYQVTFVANWLDGSSPPESIQELKIDFRLHYFIRRPMFYFRTNCCYLKRAPGSRARLACLSHRRPSTHCEGWPSLSGCPSDGGRAEPCPTVRVPPNWVSTLWSWPSPWGLLGCQTRISVTEMLPGPLPHKASSQGSPQFLSSPHRCLKASFSLATLGMPVWEPCFSTRDVTPRS